MDTYDLHIDRAPYDGAIAETTPDAQRAAQWTDGSVTVHRDGVAYATMRVHGPHGVALVAIDGDGKTAFDC